jgi:hypothetical protein
MNAIKQQIAEDHRRFSRHYQEILHRHSRLIFSISQSSEEQDMKEGFDYFLSFNKVNIAVRNRGYYYLDKFGDFTIRSRSMNGGKTEIDKIREGCGDIYLYVWQNKKGTNLHTYLLIDLNKFRDSGLADKDKKYVKNTDGTCFFSYTIQELYRADCVLALNKFRLETN